LNSSVRKFPQHLLGPAIQGFLFGGHVRGQFSPKIPGVVVEPCGAAGDLPGLNRDIRIGAHEEMHQGMGSAFELCGVEDGGEEGAGAGVFQGDDLEAARELTKARYSTRIA